MKTYHQFLGKLCVVGLCLLLSCLNVRAQDDLIIDGQPCGLHGSSASNTMEYDQNVYKNRYNLPTVSSIDPSITLAKLIDATAIAGKFSMDKAVRITGYVFNVKVGGTESCNCKTTDKVFKDTHIELTPDNRHTDPEYRLIVEVTPRVRQLMERQGIDWSTETLVEKLKGHLVTIEGWLFYDKSHEGQAFSTNPDNASGRNWRSSCWEIHPITRIDILDAEEDMAASATSQEANPSAPTSLNNYPQLPKNASKNQAMETANTPLNTLIIILIGAILGAVGQGIRVIVGIKKVSDQSAMTNTNFNDNVDYRQMAFSLFVAFGIGGVAGVLAVISADSITFTKSTIIAFITAGYAGTDFIEGFIKKNTGVTKKSSDS